MKIDGEYLSKTAFVVKQNFEPPKFEKKSVPRWAQYGGAGAAGGALLLPLIRKLINKQYESDENPTWRDALLGAVLGGASGVGAHHLTKKPSDGEVTVGGRTVKREEARDALARQAALQHNPGLIEKLTGAGFIPNTLAAMGIGEVGGHLGKILFGGDPAKTGVLSSLVDWSRHAKLTGGKMQTMSNDKLKKIYAEFNELLSSGKINPISDKIKPSIVDVDNNVVGLEKYKVRNPKTGKLETKQRPAEYNDLWNRQGSLRTDDTALGFVSKNPQLAEEIAGKIRGTQFKRGLRTGAIGATTVAAGAMGNIVHNIQKARRQARTRRALDQRLDGQKKQESK